MKKLVSSVLVAAMCLTMWPQAALATDVPETVAHGPMVQAAGQQADFATKERVGEKAQDEMQDENVVQRQQQQQPTFDVMNLRAEMMGGTAVMAASAEDDIATYDGEGTSAATVVKVGNVTVTDTNAANVLGDGRVKYDAATKTLTLTNANITTGSEEMGVFAEGDLCYFGVKSSGELTVNLVGNNTITVPANANAVYSVGLCATDLKITGTGTLTVTAGAAEHSYGVMVNNVTVGEGVTLNATGNTATETRENSSVESAGIYAFSSVDIGKNAKVTANGGSATSTGTAYSNGILLYDVNNSEPETYIIAGTLTVADGATLTATGGAAKGAYAGCSYGIQVGGSVNVGKATVTATGGTATANAYAYSCGIYNTSAMDEDFGVKDGIVRVKDGATVTATGGNVTVTDVTNYYGEAWSYGIYSNAGVQVDEATVNAIGGTATAGSSNDEYYSSAYSYGIYVGCTSIDVGDSDTDGDADDETDDNVVYIGGLNIGKNAKVTATAGKATADSAISEGIYCLDYDGTLGIEVGENATVTATAGEASGGYNMSADGIWDYGYMEIGANATVTATGGKATITGDYKNAGAYSNGVYVSDEMVLDEKATLNGTGGNVTAVDYGASYGVYAYIGMVVGNDATVNAKAGNATASGTIDVNSDYYPAAYSDGIYVNYWYDGTLFRGDLLVGNAATVTATSGNVSASGRSGSYGIYVSGNYGYGDIIIGEGSKMTSTAGTATATGLKEERAAGRSYGIYTYEDLTVVEKATVNATGNNVTAGYEGYSEGVYVGGDALVQKNATLNATSGTVTAGEGGCSSGIYCYYKLNAEDGATVTATAKKVTSGEDGYSYGVYTWDRMELDANATLTSIAGDVTAGDEGYSYGVFVNDWLESVSDDYDDDDDDDDYNVADDGDVDDDDENRGSFEQGNECIFHGDLLVGDGATVNGRGGNVSANNESESFGIYVDGRYDDYRNPYGDIIIGKGAKVMGTAGTATVTNPDKTSDDVYIYAYGYSEGIYTYAEMTVGEKATVTGTGSNVTMTGLENDEYMVYGYGASCGLWIGADMTVADEATVVATGGNVTSAGNGYGTVQNGGMWIYGGLDIGKATVVASAGTAAAGTVYRNGNYAESWGTYAECGVQIAEGGVLQTTGGTATYINPNNSATKGKYVSAYSYGLEMYYSEVPSVIEGSLVATAGNAYGSYDAEYDGDNGSSGYAGSYGVVSRYSDLQVEDGANVKSQSGHVETTCTNDDVTAYSEAISVWGGNFTMNGGAVYGISGTANTYTSGINIWSSTSGGRTYGGNLTVKGGWLKAESDGEPIVVEQAYSLGEGVSIVTPEGGEFKVFSEAATDNYNAYDYWAVVKDDTPATTVVIWDGKTDEFKAPVININTGSSGGGGGSSKKDTTTTTPEVTTPETPSGTDNKFTDVKEDDYFGPAVNWATGKGITGGTTATTFGPYEACTRAQVVTFLWRAAGCPTVDTDIAFTDVDSAAYYAEAIRWAASLGIVDGYGDGTFGPNDTVTREQVAAILFRFAKAEGMDTTQGGMQIREFADYESISEYAIAAMQWAVNAGIMQGYDNCLTPEDECIRAQIVTMLYRLLGE